MSTIYYSTIDDEPPHDIKWKIHLKRDFPDFYLHSFDEACDRYNYHRRRKTPQTSLRETMPRDLQEEWNNLQGAVAFSIMLGEHGVDIGPADLHWGDHSAEAKETSRAGSVLPGVSVYVPRIQGGGLIIRRPEAVEYPELIFVLVRRLLRGKPSEYLRAIGWRRAAEGYRSGKNSGWKGKPLRDPTDHLIPRVNSMQSLLDEPEVRL